jgi:integrase
VAVPARCPRQRPIGCCGLVEMVRPLLRKQGVKDTAKVFHSFRHSVTDALRRGKVDHELREALVGHSLGSKVDYGAKQMLSRWGAAALKDAVSQISYPGLDLSRVKPFGTSKSTRNRK